MVLLQSYYYSSQFEEAVKVGEKLLSKPLFEKSKTQFMYGLSLSELGTKNDAQTILKKIDQRYSNYSERLVLAEFLFENGKTEESKEIVEEMLSEQEHMTKPNKSLYRNTFNKISSFHKEIS